MSWCSVRGYGCDAPRAASICGGRATPVRAFDFARAHPLLDDGRLRVDRLGRTLGHFSLEAQRWWTIVGPISAATAVFGDVARTAQLYDSEGARHGAIAGGSAHLAVPTLRAIQCPMSRRALPTAPPLSVTYSLIPSGIPTTSPPVDAPENMLEFASIPFPSVKNLGSVRVVDTVSLM